MPVYSEHPEYKKYLERWAMTRAVVANDAKKYIRIVDSNDYERSRQYREDAILTNFTKLTKDGLTGLIFKKPSMIQLPPEIEYLLDDATGQLMKLDQLANHTTGEVLQTGRYGILVDYPQATPGMNLLDSDDSGYLARMLPYTAESILNHHSTSKGSRYILDLVTLREELLELADDGLAWKEKCQYRVLALDVNGYYNQSVYNEQDELIEGPIYPLDSKGKRWTEIPFQFIGSENNNGDYDEIPLYDLAILNIGHYRNSADYEESVFITGQPMGVWAISGSPEEFKSANPAGIKWGSRSGVNVGEGGHGTLLQANPNQLADTAMKRKEEQALSIGARFVMQSQGRETAEGARIRYLSQNSALYVLTHNISQGFERAIKWACLYMGGNPDEVVYHLNDRFFDESADPNLIAQMWLGFDRGVIARSDIIEYGRKTGFISESRTDEEIQAEVAAEVADMQPPLHVNNTKMKNDAVASPTTPDLNGK